MNSDLAKEKVQALKSLLQARFPEAHRVKAPTPEALRRCLRTGFPEVDALGLPESGLFELVSPEPHYGSGLVLCRLLEAVTWEGHPVAVVDGRDTLDAAALPEGVNERLLWVRCREAREVLKAADLLLRDGNVRHVFLDLQLNTQRELRQVPSPWWFRLRHLVEEQGSWVLAITPQPLLGCAEYRLRLEEPFPLEAQSCPRRALAKRARFVVERQRQRRQQREA